jgi:hypothetical protein
MSVSTRSRSAALAQRGRALPFAAGLLAALAHGCTAITGPPSIGPDPFDPNVRVPAVSYRSTVAAYASQRPVEPRSWREQNESVAPAPKQ